MVGFGIDGDTSNHEDEYVCTRNENEKSIEVVMWARCICFPVKVNLFNVPSGLIHTHTHVQILDHKIVTKTLTQPTSRKISMEKLWIYIVVLHFTLFLSHQFKFYLSMFQVYAYTRSFIVLANTKSSLLSTVKIYYRS